MVRVIRMFVEFWDRTPLAEQEAHHRPAQGQRRAARRRATRPTCPTTPPTRRGAVSPSTPTSAWPTRARPQTERNLILRRGFSYARGYDGAGQLDQGLAFVCFQRSLETGFLAVQERLNGEPLEEYIRPEGGGFFFALPGVTAPGGHLAQGLLDA